MTNPDYTHLLVIADRSGSMVSIEADMNGGLKSFLEEQDAFPGKLLVDVVTFDSTAEQVYSNAAVSEIKHPLIVPRGGTALNDAIGLGVSKLGEKLAGISEDERPGKVLVMIVTDGGENSSREYQTADIKKIVEKQQNDYAWEFMFLGANIDAFAVAGGYGIRKGSTVQYDANAAGAQSVLRGASAFATSTRSGLVADLTEQHLKAKESVSNG